MTEILTGGPRRASTTLLVRSLAMVAVVVGVGLAACAMPPLASAQGNAPQIAGPDNTSP